MTPYYLLLVTAILAALSQMRTMPSQFYAARWSMSWRIIFVAMSVMIGLRYEIGADWNLYEDQISALNNSTFFQAFQQSDPGYGVLNWFGSFWGGLYLVNSICAIIFTWGLLSFCRSQPLPWVALVVAIPYLVIVVGMGYTRQSVAIGISMLALLSLANGRVFKFVGWIALAALFHKSAIILLPFAILASTKEKVWTILWVGITGTVLFVLLLQESVDSLIYGYFERRYESSGALVRIAMNALPASVFILFRRRFGLPQNEEKFWMWVSWSALGLGVALYFSPSSTAVDRVALYWIPLQLFVFARLPVALDRFLLNKNGWIFTVVFYSAVVQSVWLFLANHSNAWLPYQFYPWVSIWD